ncbi:hypothetical protein A4D02_14075 [Niastella koreensis]|uniref:GCN5-related N-acetyltransferase n=2 Tax=Niastella koreensis TaxID=354356 RepID=G8TRF4_NIAKG|nr:GNAT family N-acetyltransferase [Niastella koreensis]AEW01085.1 GCN5-related N-acetyltransferase [Niastella koreensis GR20-10]OQP41804.1 hypothetical protein A4D02_14075 [Niastella koreensis]
MNDMFKIEVSEDPVETIGFLEEKIYEYNSLEINKSDGAFFSRVIRSDKGVIVGGVAGWTWAGACEVTHLWVDKSMRNNGVGKLLLEAAGTEAKSKGCSTILIKSYEFQAPHFYEKYGYKIEYIQKNFPPGFNYYILTKRID